MGRRLIEFSTALRATGVIFFSSVVGILTNGWFGPPVNLRLNDGRRVEGLVAKEWHQRRLALFVDCRPREDFLEAHIPGALSMPNYATFRLKSNVLKNAHRLVLYGNMDSVETDSWLLRFKERELPHTVLLAGGLDSWRAAGYPTACR